MKIGYPCINRSIGCSANSTFRLASYSEERLISTIKNNLDCLKKILEYNLEKGFLFFRISSDTVPFASHPICEFDWQKHFSKDLKEIGDFIKKNNMRISMHPDQFVLINALDQKIITKSIEDLKWQCQLLDLMGLDSSAKVQIHVGGVYGDKSAAIKRFIEEYKKLSSEIKKRLVIENDDRLFSLKDCLYINSQTKIPILFDVFHHKCLSNSESISSAIKLASGTWKKEDGVLMVDYSSQAKEERTGKHSEHIDSNDFEDFIKQIKDVDCDIMLEIKDKEESGLEALRIAKKFVRSGKI